MSDRAVVEDLLKAAGEASGHARIIWVTFLLFGTYLAIAVGSMPHVDLLAGRPVALPLLQNVRLDLFAFFWVAPTLFMIYHLYTLVAHYLLARKLHAFNAALAASGIIRSEREGYRLRLHPYVIAQSLAGARRGSVPSLAMLVTSWISLVFAPVILLLAFQIRFLPYHSVEMAWTHRILLAIDLAMIWALWPLVLHPSGRMRELLRDVAIVPVVGLYAKFRAAAHASRDLASRAMRGPDRWAVVRDLWGIQRELQRSAENVVNAVSASLVLGLISLIVGGFSIFVATIPDEGVERWLVGVLRAPEGWMARAAARAMPVVPVGDRFTLAMTAELFEGGVDAVRRRPISLFSRNLVVVNESVGGAEGLNLRGRDLRYALLDQSRFEAVDFTAALLDGASFRQAVLVGAVFDGAVARRADFAMAGLAGASFRTSATVLTGVGGGKAQIGPPFDGTSSNFFRADLPAADFTRALLEDAEFAGASLTGATFSGAWLLGAIFDSADLRGASLVSAQLPGASLIAARLLGVAADSAHLTGASLQAADLSGVSLRRAHLQGAELQGARLDAADLELANLWRASGEPVSNLQPRVGGVRSEPLSPAQAAHIDAILAKPREFGPRYQLSRVSVFERLARLRSDDALFIQAAQDQLMARLAAAAEPLVPPAGGAPDPWRVYLTWMLGAPSVDRHSVPRRHELLTALACTPDHAPFVAARMAERILADAFTGPGLGWDQDRAHLAAQLLDPACRGAAALPADVRRRLAEGVLLPRITR